MNLHSNKRSSSDDINERRKRRRTISNDLYRGFSINGTEDNKDASDLSSMSSDSDEEDDSNVPNASSSSQCDRCSKCKCDEVPKLLKVHNEVLSLLTEMKKKNNEIHKSVMLELQICRQEIIEEVQQLRQSFTRMTERLIRRSNNNNQNLGMLEYMDDDNETEEASDSETSQDEDFLDDFLR
ncbi:uncharacterized protein LOC129579419 [Sitodiplosis mosellana]|uniref:uncharacterized protein LOC129579419 n=1 Tax=Sitodiplosis mosellana TaxID=263140 RepID=UPI0024447F0B|nr:uncharacterized protein LOC129579419 [Sitodiplosis mosellana]